MLYISIFKISVSDCSILTCLLELSALSIMNNNNKTLKFFALFPFIKIDELN